MSYHPAAAEVHVEFAIPSSTPDRSQTVQVLKDEFATMRDGVRLGGDVYLPQSLPAPAIVIRVPYGKEVAEMGFDVVGRFFARKGYACLVQDVRGKFTSGGEFDPGVNEIADGFDTVEWVTAQEWSDGRVGLWGESYYGLTSYAAAISGHPAIACIAPGDIGLDRRASWLRQGAFLQNTTGYWAIAMDGREYGDVAAVDPYTLPLIDLPASCGAEGTFFRSLLLHADDPDWWDDRSLAENIDQLRVPILCWGGWYDNYIGPLLQDYARIVAAHPAPETVHLLVGPWDHEGTGDYTDRAVCHVLPPTAEHRWARYVEFFDRYLRGEPNGFGRDGRVDVFTLGPHRWQQLSSWPPPGVEPAALHLRAGGRLTLEPPVDSEPADAYSYDPLNPVTETVGRNCWALCTALDDRRRLDDRDDIMRYVSDPLEHDLELLGPIEAELHAATSAIDTDFTVTLCHVFADGTVNTVQDGIVRARYRNGLDRPAPVTPGEIVGYTIAMNAASYVIPRGDRIRVDISSSNFDRYDRNLNTGEPIGIGSEPITARQEIHHQPGYASQLRITVRH